MTPEEHEEYKAACAPIHEIIAMLNRQHEKALAPWYEQLFKLNSYYISPIYVLEKNLAAMDVAGILGAKPK